MQVAHEVTASLKLELRIFPLLPLNMFPPNSSHRHSFWSGLPHVDPGLFELFGCFGLPGLDGREHEFHFGLLLVEGGEEVLVGELLFGLVVSVGVIGEGEDELGVVVLLQLP